MTRTGNPMVKFTVAVSDHARQPDGSRVVRQTVVHNVVAFREEAQAIAELELQAGDPVVVTGDLLFNAYQTRGGEMRASSEIRARAVTIDATDPSITIHRAVQPPAAQTAMAPQVGRGTATGAGPSGAPRQQAPAGSAATGGPSPAQTPDGVQAPSAPPPPPHPHPPGAVDGWQRVPTWPASVAGPAGPAGPGG